MSEQTSKSNCVHANFIGLAIGVQTLFYRLYIFERLITLLLS